MLPLDNPGTNQSESVLRNRASSLRNQIGEMEVLVTRLEHHASRLAGIVAAPTEVAITLSSELPFSDDLADLIDQFGSLSTKFCEPLNRLGEYI